MGDRGGENRHKAVVVIAGESNIGKTCFCRTLKSGVYDDSAQATVGMASFALELREGLTIELNDTAGQERFRSMTSTYFRRANVAILAYDISSPKSLDALGAFYTAFKDSAPADAKAIIVGLKSDLADTASPKVDTSQAEAFAAKLEPTEAIPIVEVSSLANRGLDAFKDKLADLLGGTTRDATDAVEITGKKKGRKGCC
jgi:small GTP-binding protein